MRIKMRVVYTMLHVYYMAHLNKLNKSIKSKRPPYRPLSRRLDRCDRVIQNESRDQFGGNVYYVTMGVFDWASSVTYVLTD